jgi:hypothetical protein
MVFNEANLRRVLSAYVTAIAGDRTARWARQFQAARQGPLPRQASRKMVAEPVLGGLHHIYRAAA